MTTPEPTSVTPPGHKWRLSLRAKLFLPLFILLILFGAAALIGSLQLIDEVAKRTLDDRLSAANEVIFREFKKQEEILLVYANFLEQFHFVTNRYEEGEEIGILQDRLFAALEKEDILVTFLPFVGNVPSPLPTIDDLLLQAYRSGKPRFRYTNQLNGQPTLVVAAPLQDKGKITQMLLLQIVMGEEFLGKLTKPLGLAASLHDLSGTTLVTSGTEVTPLLLNADQISRLGIEQKLFEEHDSPQGPVRHMFTLIPLGTSDMVILSLESSIAGFSNLQQSLVVRLVLAVALTLLIGIVVYYRLVDTITRPARELIEAAKALGRGNLAYRIEEISSDELGNVAETFNKMASELETIYQEKTDKDTALALAQQEIKTRVVIERKNREVEKANDELRAHLREISALYQLNQAMVTAPELHILFDRILQVVVETLGCDQIVLLQYNPGESLLEVVRSLGLNSEALRDVKFSFDQGITGQTAQALKQTYVKDVEKEPRYLNYHGQVATRGSFVSSPMVIKGRLVGVINLHKREADAFTVSELKLIQAIGNQAAMAIDNALLTERTRDLSNTDELTGLANRRYFQECLKHEIAHSRRFGTGFSILMCDIDHFDAYNSKHGRMRGDAILRQVGQVLLNNTRGIDLVCRFGSEEFVVLLSKTDKFGGLAAAEKLRQCILDEKFEGSHDSMPEGRLTMSFGVTEFPGDSQNIYELLNFAERALYNAKQEGRNRSAAWQGPSPG